MADLDWIRLGDRTRISRRINDLRDFGVLSPKPTSNTIVLLVSATILMSCLLGHRGHAGHFHEDVSAAWNPPLWPRGGHLGARAAGIVNEQRGAFSSSASSLAPIRGRLIDVNYSCTAEVIVADQAITSTHPVQRRLLAVAPHRTLPRHE